MSKKRISENISFFSVKANQLAYNSVCGCIAGAIVSQILFYSTFRHVTADGSFQNNAYVMVLDMPCTKGSKLYGKTDIFVEWLACLHSIQQLQIFEHLCPPASVVHFAFKLIAQTENNKPRTFCIPRENI